MNRRTLAGLGLGVSIAAMAAAVALAAVHFVQRERVLSSGAQATARVLDQHYQEGARHRSRGWTVEYEFQVDGRAYRQRWHYAQARYAASPFGRVDRDHPGAVEVRYDAERPAFNLPADGAERWRQANLTAIPGNNLVIAALLFVAGGVGLVYAAAARKEAIEDEERRPAGDEDANEANRDAEQP